MAHLFHLVQGRFAALKNVILKQEQSTIIDKVVKQQNAIAQLTTGFSKSLIRMVAPLIVQEMDAGAEEGEVRNGCNIFFKCLTFLHSSLLHLTAYSVKIGHVRTSIFCCICIQ